MILKSAAVRSLKIYRFLPMFKMIEAACGYLPLTTNSKIDSSEAVNEIAELLELKNSVAKAVSENKL